MISYNETDQHLHWLSQLIAKTNRTFVPDIDDDSHTNLYFDFLGNRIVGRWIETPNNNLLLSFNLKNLSFEWLNNSLNVIESFQTTGNKISDIETEISNHLSKIELDSNGFKDPLHFQIPRYSFDDEKIKRIPYENIAEWKHYRNIANNACYSLLGYLQINGEIRIWPHHFDTGTYVITDNGMGIGFGLAMEDPLIGNPYFYMSGYPTSGSMEYKNLPELSIGNWVITENWSGAVLPLTDLKQLSNEEQTVAINGYIISSLNWFINK
jgi:hypothetical protein